MAKTVSDLTHTGQVNSFTGGLNTDLHPLVQPNDTLTDCINGTLITYNGNENMLQNDVGNYALEGSELPDGFIPLGMKEHNGVAYIVSHNPMTKEVQIGSYPSPKRIDVENGQQTLKSDPIPMTIIINATPYPTNYSYDNCVKYWCVESRKSPETQYTEFDVELNFGDEYAISSMAGNLDFQYEQFAIKEDSGKITNINPITDGEMHTVNWTSCGQLLKKYVLNKVTNFTQEVDWQVFEGSKTRIVGGLPEDEHIYPDEDLQSITIKNTVKFDRIDVVREDNDEVLVGVLHKIITGNPKAFANDSDRKPLESYTKTHNILETTNFDGNTEYKFTTNISSNNFLYFLRKWVELEGDKIVSSAYIGPIEIQSYPILIHRVNGEDKSVLLYDESGKQTFISELDVKGNFVYQYYCEPANDLTKVYLKLDGLDTSKGFKANLLYLQKSGSLLTTNELDVEKLSNLIFKYNSESGYWEGLLKTADSVLFFEADILNSHYIFPLFTSVNFEVYKQYASKYDNFCLIPGDKLLDISTSGENIEVGDTKTIKYVKLTDKLNIHDEPFYTSVYFHDNVNTYYGDVECGNITINNYSGNRVTLELQKQNNDGSWTTIDKKSTSVTNGTATFKDCIVSANIQKAAEGVPIDKCFERIYLAKMGHAPFAHSENAQERNQDDWLNRFRSNTGFNEKLFKKLITYGDWEKKKSLYVDKHCGKHNNEFIVNTCDIYGNKDDKKSSRTHATVDSWNTEFDEDQLFVPITFNVNCKTANMGIVCFKTDGTTETDNRYNINFSTILAKSKKNPVIVLHKDLLFYNGNKPNPTKFDTWLMYLYTHAFYYEELATTSQNFKLINANTATKLQYIINGDFTKSIKIGDIIITDKVKNILQSQIKHKCNNFNSNIMSLDSDIQYTIDTTDSNKQWSLIYNIMLSIHDDSNGQLNTLYWDVCSNDVWSVVSWSEMAWLGDPNALAWHYFDYNLDLTKYTCLSTENDIIWTGGKNREPVVLAKSSSALHDKTGWEWHLTDIKSYDFSPRFKQIINYDTDD